MTRGTPSASHAAALRELLDQIDALVVFASDAPITVSLKGKIERAVNRLGDAIIEELRPVEQQLAKEMLAAPRKEAKS